MKTASELLAEGLGDLLTSEMTRRCGATYPSLTEVVPSPPSLLLTASRAATPFITTSSIQCS